MRLLPYLLVLSLWAQCGVAQEKRFSLAAPETLIETGFLKHLLPRFSLKTGIRITVVSPSDAHDASFGADGTPVFEGLGQLWHLSARETQFTKRFRGWLQSDVGARTISAFAPDGNSLFSPDVGVVVVEETPEITGDTVRGEEVSLRQCGRCHVINAKNRMNAIGSTPSFAVMRTFPDWQGRFEAFFVLKPHGAFTQIEDVTEPFSNQRPPPIVPIELTLDDLDAILAYVATIPPADLGAPIKSQ